MAMTRPDPRVDVFLVGSQYSGTTHLGGLLAANLGAVYAGEMAHLPRFVKEYRIYDDPIGCLLCTAVDRPCPVWTTDVVAAAEDAGPAGSMDVLRRWTGSSVIVDGSKMPQWLRLATETRPEGAARAVVVVTARSPLRYVISASGSTGAPIWETAQWWRDIYVDTLRTISRRQLPMLVVHNEAVRRQPLETVAAIASLLGREAPAELHTAVPTHSIAGNLWVQQGYSARTDDLQRKLGLRGDDVASPTGEQWDAVTRRASMAEVGRPKSRRSALEMAQMVIECPGLTDVAHALGYHLAMDIDELVSQATD